MSAPQNPPAFPSVEAGGPNQDWPVHFHGMTLRDWFAGQALGSLDLGSNPGRLSCDASAQTAYMIADAMLAARGDA